MLKDAQVIEGADSALADRKNMVYAGTLVTGGQGLAVVVATGRFMEIGKLQEMIGETEAPRTPMERQLNTVGNQLVWACASICGLVFMMGLMRRTPFGADSQNYYFSCRCRGPGGASGSCHDDPCAGYP